MKTDRELAIGYREIAFRSFDSLTTTRDMLREVVDKAQNGPPQGDADGSLVDPEWTEMRALVDALTRLLSMRTS